MRIRKAVITAALSAAAIGGLAAVPALASSPASVTTVVAAHAPFVGHDVSGSLLTRHPVFVGQRINLVGSNGGRITNYRVTSVHRDGATFRATVRPRLQSVDGSAVLFTTSY